eukprot:Blabericola_migrator_1__1436@NODE_1377_length_4688_cov_1003_981822_g923_i0_p3_GENE_NODE_1377_length_4688_cov_1003_981822_g923_i0NODE_1377_length_4688_cov_1003_981822_g923_i0_p3_ORF_typecomplete_len211_score32_24Pkinase/PF00069_25/1_6e16Pkinase_Tyr/PF07714_17/4_8e13Kinaselike/PF14531_6/2_9e05_NODE_1377_length_4688_cov_1003_981822_g923_i035764208
MIFFPQSQPYSWASDIWSLGCVLYELCALRVPFEANNMKALVTRIVEGRPPILPLQYSNDLRNLYNRLLAKNPSDRPTATDILCEPFIRVECELMLQEEAGRRLTSSPIFLPSPPYGSTPVSRHHDDSSHHDSELSPPSSHHRAKKPQYKQFPSFLAADSKPKGRKDLVMVSRLVNQPVAMASAPQTKCSSILKPFRWAGAIRRMKAQSL